MIGLILLQINITGDIQKDQQLLLYGIGGLIALIVLAMIVIVIIVLVRKSRRNKNAAIQAQASIPAPQTQQEVQEKTYGPATTIAQETKPEEIKQEEQKADPIPVAEEQKTEPVIVLPTEKTEPTPQPIEEKKFDSKSHKEVLDSQNPTDKMEEIRRRLEEIKNQKNTDPVPVLPKITAKPKEIEPVIEEIKNTESDPFNEQEPSFTEEVDETIIVEDSESVAIPIIDMADEILEETETAQINNQPETTIVEDEGVMKEVLVLEQEPAEEEPVESVNEIKVPATSHLPNGKYLPMKKLTFAEWVELFK